MEEARTPVALGPQAHARLWSRLYEHPGSWPLEVGITARAERRLPERSPYSVPVLLILKRLCVPACDSGSALARWAGGLRKMANVIHPPPTSSSNAPKTEKRLGRGAVKSGA